MIDVIMIMGFLGSGKTTLLEHILNNKDERVGVVVNEFGSVSVDGERLSVIEDAEIMEVNSGSIFCACKSDFFIQSVLSLMEMGLKKIYVESSGLSNPSSVEKIMSDLNSLNKSSEDVHVSTFVCVADAERIQTLLKVSVAAVSQVQRSHVILLNKIDNVDDAGKQGAIDAILAVNPEAKTIPCVKCAVDLSELVDKDAKAKKLECIDPEPISERSFAILNQRSVKRDNLDVFLNAILSISVRIKGFMVVDDVKHYIDIVPPYITIEPKEKAVSNELVIIVHEDEKLTAKKQIETQWQQAFGDAPPKIVV